MKKILDFITNKKHTPFIPLILLFFYFIFIDSSRHYTFQTNYLDFFFNHNSIYNLSNSQGSFIPFYWMAATPLGLIFLKTALILIGTYPLLKLFQKYISDTHTPYFYLLYFFYLPLRRFSFSDLHGEFFMMAIISWIIYFLILKNYRRSFFLSLLLFFTKENFILLTLPISIYFYLKKNPNYGASLFLLSILWMFFIFKFYFPFMLLKTDISQPYFFLYFFSGFGDTFQEIALYCFTHPIIFLKKILTYDKLFHFILLFAPFGFLSFASPICLLGLGILLQNYLMPYDMYKIYMHYSLPLTPIIVSSAILGYATFKPKLVQATYLKNTLKLTLSVFIFSNIVLFMVFDLRTFISSPDIKITHQLINKLPKSSHLLTTSNYVPHLNDHQLTLMRPNTYQQPFDFILMANQQPLDYEILQSPIKYMLSALEKKQYKHYFTRWLHGEREYTYLSTENYKNLIHYFKTHPNYTLINENKDSLFFKRKP